MTNDKWLLYRHGPDQFQSDDRALVQSDLLAFGQKDSRDHASAQPRYTSNGRPSGDAESTGTRTPCQNSDRHSGPTDHGSFGDVIKNIAAGRALLQRPFAVGLHFFVAREIGGRFHDGGDLLLRSLQTYAVESY